MATLIERQAAELEALIRACALAGKSPKEIADQVGMTANTIREKAKALGVKLNYTSRSRLPEIADQTQQMIEMELSQMASRYGLTTKQIVSLMMRRLYHKPKAKGLHIEASQAA